MSSLSKSFVFNAGAVDPLKSVPSTYKGERRAEKRPLGRFERFVDLAGNVVQRTLVNPGVQPTADRIGAARTRAHMESARINGEEIQGSIEHGKCPLRHGLRYLTPAISAEFAQMPPALNEPCHEDPITVTKGRNGGPREFHDGCAHIQWLIESRRARKAADSAAKRKVQVDHRAEQLALAAQQLDEQRKTNERMAQALEALTAAQPKRKASDA